MENRLLSINKSAKLLGICSQTLRNWEERKDFPFKVHYTLGGHRRYSSLEIENYLEKQQKDGDSIE